jgi:hypothetical protein
LEILLIVKYQSEFSMKAQFCGAAYQFLGIRDAQFCTTFGIVTQFLVLLYEDLPQRWFFLRSISTPEDSGFYMDCF